MSWIEIFFIQQLPFLYILMGDFVPQVTFGQVGLQTNLVVTTWRGALLTSSE